MNAVVMSYKVGDETCNCPNMAASKAKASDSTVAYLVGDECTECELTARLNLAHAKYKATVDTRAGS